MKNENGSPRREAGQAALIVLMGMAIALTAVLSILASSTTDIKISTNESESLRAFSAAESGAEKALVTSAGSNGPVGDASYVATVNPLFQGQKIIYYPENLVNGTSATLWFVAHDPVTGALTCPGNTCFLGRFFNIYWGSSGYSANSATTPAIEATLYYLSNPLDATTIKVTRFLIDPNTGRRAGNGYAAPNACSGATPYVLGPHSYAFQDCLDLFTLMGSTFTFPQQPTSAKFLIVKMLYNSDVTQPIAFQADSALPTQGNTIDSTGTLSNSSRKVEVVRDFNQVPSLFDSAIYSPQGLTQ